jgi:hypothetical protein
MERLREGEMGRWSEQRTIFDAKVSAVGYATKLQTSPSWAEEAGLKPIELVVV